MWQTHDRYVYNQEKNVTSFYLQLIWLIFWGPLKIFLIDHIVVIQNSDVEEYWWFSATQTIVLLSDTEGQWTFLPLALVTMFSLMILADNVTLLRYVDWLIDWLIDWITFNVLLGNMTNGCKICLSWFLLPLNREGSLSCQTCCDTEPQFTRKGMHLIQSPNTTNKEYWEHILTRFVYSP